MPKTGSGKKFRDALLRYIRSWDQDIEARTEQFAGWRFVGNPRKLDIVIRHKDRFLGIEAKYQDVGGTVDQKLIYTLEDAKASPFPTLVVFAGPGIKQDIKARLISSGIGLEIIYDPDKPDGQRIEDKNLLFKQRVYIELGLNWFELYPPKR